MLQRGDAKGALTNLLSSKVTPEGIQIVTDSLASLKDTSLLSGLNPAQVDCLMQNVLQALEFPSKYPSANLLVWHNAVCFCLVTTNVFIDCRCCWIGSHCQSLDQSCVVFPSKRSSPLFTRRAFSIKLYFKSIEMSMLVFTNW
jgi:hypothetical protein